MKNKELDKIAAIELGFEFIDQDYHTKFEPGETVPDGWVATSTGSRWYAPASSLSDTANKLRYEDRLSSCVGLYLYDASRNELYRLPHENGYQGDCDIPLWSPSTDRNQSRQVVEAASRVVSPSMWVKHLNAVNDAAPTVPTQWWVFMLDPRQEVEAAILAVREARKEHGTSSKGPQGEATSKTTSKCPKGEEGLPPTVEHTGEEV